MREMAPGLCSLSFKSNKSCLLVALEDYAEVVFILLAFRNCTGHIVVQPHDNLAEPNLASCMIVPVIEITFDVVGTPFHKLFLKVSNPCLQFLIGRRDLNLFCKNKHYQFLLFC